MRTAADARDGSRIGYTRRRHVLRSSIRVGGFMSQPYIGEIRMFAGNFPPAGWAFCNGQLTAIAENDALFALIGTTYGGDGQSTFSLPDLQGRVPIHMGTDSFGDSYVIGQKSGSETVSLVSSHIPAHSHLPRAA